MERISRSHDKFKLLKDMIKTNHYPNITVTDDLEVLKIALNNNLKINLLFYTFDEAYKDEKGWARMCLINVAKSAIFSSDRSIEDYNSLIWHLDRIKK